MNNHRFHFGGGAISLALALVLAGTAARATELIYRPISPSFGGDALNGSFLLGKAQSQNDHKGDGASLADTDPLSRFEESLQRNILNQIARQVAEEAFGEDSLGNGGVYQTDQYSIEIVTTNPDVITIRIENLETGETTVIDIPVFG